VSAGVSLSINLLSCHPFAASDFSFALPVLVLLCIQLRMPNRRQISVLSLSMARMGWNRVQEHNVNVTVEDKMKPVRA
jgi:hypothetical protein